jgi:hypothetical protein
VSIFYVWQELCTDALGQAGHDSLTLRVRYGGSSGTRSPTTNALGHAHPRFAPSAGGESHPAAVAAGLDQVLSHVAQTDHGYSMPANRFRPRRVLPEKGEGAGQKPRAW